MFLILLHCWAKLHMDTVKQSVIMQFYVVVAPSSSSFYILDYIYTSDSILVQVICFHSITQQSIVRIIMNKTKRKIKIKSLLLNCLRSFEIRCLKPSRQISVPVTKLHRQMDNQILTIQLFYFHF